MNGTVAAGSDTLPPDVATMRQAVDRLLDPHAVPKAQPPVGEELATLTLQIRGHLQLLIPVVRAAALRQHKDSVPRYCALACLGEASNRLGSQPSPAKGGDLAYARRLARALNALCDHFEALVAS
jgi:hypothetical protein